MSEPIETFAQRLREIRPSTGINQTQLAQRVSELLGSVLDPSAITRIEKGKRGVRLDEAVYIAQVLEVPLAMLLSDGDAVGGRLAELRSELRRQQAREQEAEAELRQAMTAVAYVEQEIEQLKTPPGD